MPTPYLGEIRMFAGSFAPRDWAFCNGQELSIAANEPLFQLIGTTYGGDGETIFALPDLQSRVPVHQGQGPGLSSRVLGENGGKEEVTLTLEGLPAHAHAPVASSGAGTSPNPAGNVWAASGARDNKYAAAADATMGGDAVRPTGGGQPHQNMPPYLGINFIISLQGDFPRPT